MLKDLAAVKKLVSLLEDEAHSLRVLPSNLPEPRNLSKSKGGELPDEKEGEIAAAGSDATLNEEKNADEEMAVDERDLPSKNRGSVAVEERLGKLYTELESKERLVPSGADDAVPDEQVIENKKVSVSLRPAV